MDINTLIASIQELAAITTTHMDGAARVRVELEQDPETRVELPASRHDHRVSAIEPKSLWRARAVIDGAEVSLGSGEDPLSALTKLHAGMLYRHRQGDLCRAAVLKRASDLEPRSPDGECLPSAALRLRLGYTMGDVTPSERESIGAPLVTGHDLTAAAPGTVTLPS